MQFRGGHGNGVTSMGSEQRTRLVRAWSGRAWTPRSTLFPPPRPRAFSGAFGAASERQEIGLGPRPAGGSQSPIPGAIWCSFRRAFGAIDWRPVSVRSTASYSEPITLVLRRSPVPSKTPPMRWGGRRTAHTPANIQPTSLAAWTAQAARGAAETA